MFKLAYRCSDNGGPTILQHVWNLDYAGVLVKVTTELYTRAEQYCHFSITIDPKTTIHDTE